MAIQFPCPACRQPIEVDQELAGTQVTCPYCEKVVTAPPESSLMVVGDARPADERPAPPVPSGPLAGAAELAANPWGRWGLICAVAAIVVAVVLMCAGFVYLRPIMKEMATSQGSPESVQREMDRMGAEMAKSTGFRIGSAVLLALALLGTILSIIGLTRPGRRKGQATAGLIICGCFLLCQCLGVFMQGMAAGGG